MVEEIRILVADRIAQEGIDLLRSQLPEAEIDERPGLKPDQLRAAIDNYTALIVRSETQVTSDILAAARQLKIVGRAGVGRAYWAFFAGAAIERESSETPSA